MIDVAYDPKLTDVTQTNQTRSLRMARHRERRCVRPERSQTRHGPNAMGG